MSKQPNTPDEEILDPQDIVVTLELDDGSELECQILTIFDIEDQSYIALIPTDQIENEEENCDVIFYRYFEDEDGNPSLDNIDDDDEFEIVQDCFDEMLDEEEFEEM